ncbi:MAG: MFS transporter [Candidatus Korobacteraceae bacterium]|jgi:putative MFS transporter
MQQGTQAASAETLTYRTVGHAIDQSPVTRSLVGMLIIIGLASLFDAGDAYMLGFAMPGIATEFNAKPETLGLLASGSMIGMTVGSLLWGWIADRVGRKIAFTMTLLIFSIFSGVCGLATSIGFLIGARFLAGTGIGGAIPVDASILAEFSPARIRGYCAGAMLLAWPLSTFVVSAISLVVLPHWGWRGLFFVFVVPAMLTFWIRRGVPESPRWLANRGRFAEARKALNYLQISDEAIERSRVAVQNEPPLPMLPVAVFRDLFTPQVRRRTIHTWLIWILSQMASWGIMLWLPKLFMRLYGTSLKQAVTYMLYISLMSVGGRLIVYFLLDKAGRKPFLVIGFLGTGLAICSAVFAQTAAQMLLVACLLRFFSEVALCAATIYTPEVFPLHIRVLGASSAMGLGRIGGAIGSYAVGLFVGAGHITAMWLFLGAGCLISGLLTIWLGVEPRGQNLEELNRGGTQAAARIQQPGSAAAVSGK